jgi:hypothetical protein
MRCIDSIQHSLSRLCLFEVGPTGSYYPSEDGDCPWRSFDVLQFPSVIEMFLDGRDEGYVIDQFGQGGWLIRRGIEESTIRELDTVISAF